MNSLLFSLTVLLFQLSTHLLVEANNGSFSMEIFNRYSIASPFYDPSITAEEHALKAAIQSTARANRLASSVAGIKMVLPVVAEEYTNLLRVFFGSPPVEAYGDIDTGSDLVWIQCQPCKRCFSQTFPIFNPAKSSTYRNLPCSSNLCKECGPNGNCVYSETYLSDDSTKGVMGKDTMTLYSTYGQVFPFPNFVFGCGNDNAERTSGVGVGFFGFSFGERSFIRQLGDNIENRFSMCLLGRSATKTGKIKFGQDAVLYGPGVVTTPLIIRPGLPLYLMDFDAVTVGNQRVKYNEPRTGPGNIINDSGATLTYLINNFYFAVEAAVKRAIPLSPRSPPDPYRLCYLTSAFSRFPELPFVFHFKGADVKLKKENTFLNAGYLTCFAMLPHEDLNIFGAVSQINLQVSFDLGYNTISFAPADCGNI